MQQKIEKQLLSIQKKNFLQIRKDLPKITKIYSNLLNSRSNYIFKQTQVEKNLFIRYEKNSHTYYKKGKNILRFLLTSAKFFTKSRFNI